MQVKSVTVKPMGQTRRQKPRWLRFHERDKHSSFQNFSSLFWFVLKISWSSTFVLILQFVNPIQLQSNYLWNCFFVVVCCHFNKQPLFKVTNKLIFVMKNRLTSVIEWPSDITATVTVNPFEAVEGVWVESSISIVQSSTSHVIQTDRQRALQSG